jgi:hypothetical protein
MDSKERIRRVEATPKRPGHPAGETAMLDAPGLVVFTGPLAPDELAAQVTPGDTEDTLDEAEPALPRPEPDAVRVDQAHAAPVQAEKFTADIVANAAETMAMLAEHRLTRPMSLRPSREARILTLVDAIFATGDRALADLLGWWARARDDGDPWTLWPLAFLLGLVDGPDGLLALERLLEALDPGDGERVEVAANALVMIPHPAMVAFAEDLLDARSPLAQAIGLEILSRRGELDPERLEGHLGAAAPVLLAAAVRALVRAEAAAPPTERLLPLLGHPDPAVAWEAARAVTLWGAPNALDAVREGHPLGPTLGARAAELFVMAGQADDIAHVEGLLARVPLTPELLDAIGRFGNPLAWSFMLHFLIDREFCEAAEGALLTLFGPLVPPDATRTPRAWRDALAERDLDPAMRYRRGEPWTPSVVVNDCAFAGLSHIGGTHSQRAIERWLDELGARTGIPMNADLSRWTPGVDPKVLVVSERALRARWLPGAWSSARTERRGA